MFFSRYAECVEGASGSKRQEKDIVHSPEDFSWACGAGVRRRSLEEKSARMGLVECVNHYLLDEYPVISTVDGKPVVHYKFTVLLVTNGTDRISGEVIDAAAFPSEKKCEDEKICAIMKEPAMKKKSKKSKAKKAAKKDE